MTPACAGLLRNGATVGQDVITEDDISGDRSTEDRSTTLSRRAA
jgi:hypothetical protein